MDSCALCNNQLFEFKMPPIGYDHKKANPTGFGAYYGNSMACCMWYANTKIPEGWSLNSSEFLCPKCSNK